MNITLSGIDEKTDIDLLNESILKLEIETIEAGILYTFSPDGRNRYPRKEWILETVPKLKNVSIHICGSRARQQLLNGELDNILVSVDRIQVNGKVDEETLNKLCYKYKKQYIITQHYNENIDLLKTIWANHSILIDSSGGRGITPTSWPKLNTYKYIGYAGGLDADSITVQSEGIKKVLGWNSTTSWVDAESKLRDENDWFSIDKARKFIEATNRAFYVQDVELYSATNDRS